MVDATTTDPVQQGSILHYTSIFIGAMVLVYMTYLIVGGGPTNENNNNDDDSDNDDDDNEGGNNVDDLDAMERGEVAEQVEPAPKSKKTSTHSIAHEDIINKQIVYVHVDLEDGGPMCGLLQISAIILDADLNEIGRFDEYIKPPDTAIWDEQVCELSHKYHKNHPNIISRSTANWSGMAQDGVWGREAYHWWQSGNVAGMEW